MSLDWPLVVLGILVALLGAAVGATVARLPIRNRQKRWSASKATAVLLIGFMTFLTMMYSFYLVRNVGDSGEWKFWIPISMCAIAFVGQVYYLVDIARNWDDMSPDDRGKRTVQGIFIPPLFAIGSFVTIAIGVVALAIWALAAGNSSGGSSSSGSGPRYRDLKDRYGNRLGSLDSQTGEVKDRYGNRTGWIE